MFSQIDKSFENIFNIVFYGLIVVVVLSQLGFDPLAMFLSISGVILAFAFSTSCSHFLLYWHGALRLTSAFVSFFSDRCC
jgi:small-conductance mechanosensitive channel